MHESGRFALRFVDHDNCDVHFLPNGDLISELASVGYALKLVEHLSFLLVDLDKGETGQMYCGTFEGITGESTERVEAAIKKAGDEYSKSIRKMVQW